MIRSATCIHMRLSRMETSVIMTLTLLTPNIGLPEMLEEAIAR